MAYFLILILLLFAGCGDEKSEVAVKDRFEESLQSAADVGTLERLTQDGRCIYPMFAPGDSIIYFRRLLATDEQAAAGIDLEKLIKPFGLNIRTKELYTLSEDYAYPQLTYVEYSKLPPIAGEPLSFGVYSGDSSIFAFETQEDNLRKRRKIYLYKSDQFLQLTFGDLSCMLEKFSNTGKYLIGLHDWNPSWLLIFDLASGSNYIIKRDIDMIDYMAQFSSDDKMMIFIRSENKVVLDKAPFGDIWLFKFSQ